MSIKFALYDGRFSITITSSDCIYLKALKFKYQIPYKNPAVNSDMTVLNQLGIGIQRLYMDPFIQTD